jgi:hypothetical protein
VVRIPAGEKVIETGVKLARIVKVAVRSATFDKIINCSYQADPLATPWPYQADPLARIWQEMPLMQ